MTSAQTFYTEALIAAGLGAALAEAEPQPAEPQPAEPQPVESQPVALQPVQLQPQLSLPMAAFIDPNVSEASPGASSGCETLILDAGGFGKLKLQPASPSDGLSTGTAL